MDILADFDEFFEDSEFQQAFEDAEFRAQLAADLRAIRKAAALSQKDVAKAMKTSQSAVSDFERGETDPYLSTVQRYLRAVGARMRIILDSPHSNVARLNTTSPYARMNTTVHVTTTKEHVATADSRPTPYTSAS